MFDRIAGFYDLMNSVMTAGLHHRWRARAADLARVGPGDRVLDVATGTGDLALELARRVAPGGEGSARTSPRGCSSAPAEGAPGPRVRFEWGNALELPYADDAFDAATVGFGARNFSDLDRGLREMARVVRPGGRVVVLEITTPTRPPLSTFFSLWFDRVVPLMGRSTGEPEAYTYLPELGEALPGPRGARRRDGAAGLGDVRWILTAGGIIAIHAGTGADGLGRGRSPRSSRRRARTCRSCCGGSRSGWPLVATAHGPVLAEHAGTTIAAGGKRLRPLLVVLAAGGAPATASCARAVAVELVHSATLVHDDVLDGAALRRGRPTVVAAAGRAMATATGDLLFARAFAELAANGRRRRGARAERRRVGARRGRAAAARRRLERRRAGRALPAPLRAQDRVPVRGGLPARRAGGRRPRTTRWGASAAASGWPSSSSTTCSTCQARPSAPASTAAPTCSTARSRCRFILARERDPDLAALDPRSVRTPEQAEEVCDAIAATGALEDARRGALAMVAGGEGGPAGAAARAAAPALELVADGVVDRYA